MSMHWLLPIILEGAVRSPNPMGGKLAVSMATFLTPLSTVDARMDTALTNPSWDTWR